MPTVADPWKRAPAWSAWAAAGLSLPLYLILTYVVPREHSGRLVLLWMGLFALYGVILLRQPLVTNLKHWRRMAFVLRAFLLFSIPTLSDDFYRYLWDGFMTLEGRNPFSTSPDALVAAGYHSHHALYELINWPSYQSVYPPGAQGLFALSSFGLKENFVYGVIFLKVIVLCLDMGTIRLLEKVLPYFGKPASLALVYAFNPLVILEICGNAHMEGPAIFFLVLGLFLLAKKQSWWATVPIAVAVSIKLLPMLLVPFLAKSLGWGKGVLWGLAVTALFLLSYLPFGLQALLDHLGNLPVYFQDLEFNGSVYYAFKWLGYQWAGWPWVLRGLFLLTLLWIGLRQKTNLSAALWASFAAYGVYCLISASLHPWYGLFLLVLGLFTRSRLGLAWTLLLPWTYLAYGNEAMQLPKVVPMLEYSILATLAFWEWREARAYQPPDGSVSAGGSS